MLPFFAIAQKENTLISKGNDEYKKGEFGKAEENYRKALEKDKSSTPAMFNLGNALQQQNKSEEADKEYDALLTDDNLPADLKGNTYYNKGVSYAKQKKFPEAADAFKQSLKVDPSDNNTRENLQKVLNEIKKQQQQQQQQQQNQQKKQDQKKKEEKHQQQPNQPKTNLSMQKAEQLLDQLREKEKQLQNQVQKQRVTNQQPEKDW
jgi:Ca-activated chloride channel homolog